MNIIQIKINHRFNSKKIFVRRMERDWWNRVLEDRSTSENRDLTLGIPRQFAKTGAHGEQVRDTGSTFPPLSASSPSLFHVLS